MASNEWDSPQPIRLPTRHSLLAIRHLAPLPDKDTSAIIEA